MVRDVSLLVSLLHLIAADSERDTFAIPHIFLEQIDLDFVAARRRISSLIVELLGREGEARTSRVERSI